MSHNLEIIKSLFRQIALYNDQKAFADLFRMKYKELFKFSLQYVEHPENAEEVVNDVFVKLWKYRVGLLDIKNPDSYLYIAVKNQSLNYIKKYSNLHIALSQDGQATSLISGGHPQEEIEWKEVYHSLNQVVDGLPDQCRKIFYLVKMEGFKAQQVAAVLSISVRTVETQLYRAMKRLKEVLSDQLNKSKIGRSSMYLLFFISFFKWL